MLVREVEIINRLGLHARPAMLFVETANRFRSRVTVYNSQKKVNGKSIMEMMLLEAYRGTVLRLEAEGDDAEECLGALVECVRDKFILEDLPQAKS